MLQDTREILWKNDVELWGSLKNKRVFLTGGTGFFGKSFLDLITYYNIKNNLNLKVTVLTRDSKKFVTEFPEFKASEYLSYVNSDVTNFEFVDVPFDYILHFATPANSSFSREFPLEVFDIICVGSRRVLDFAKSIKVKAVLLASSGAVYGKQPSNLTHIPEEFTGGPDTCSSGSVYGEAKRAAELLGNIYSDLYGFDHKIARCFAFVGPYLDPHASYAIGNFIKNAVLNEDIIIKGDGTDTRSYMYSDDLVYSLLKVLIFGKNKKAYNIGSDQSLSISELANLVAQQVNPCLDVKIMQKAKDGAIPNRYIPNVDLIKNELKLHPTVSIQQAIINTAEYYKKTL